ncbi:eCIS core domain-containing protein [Coleofasciculus sp. F4-SAH-05]|uniref:eCIS core domain-containing protein n=1 Tax=Coleofasciculus sp. F4-SAH-05 TaxID=3069525 RepID=UPI0032F63FE7
MGSRRRLNKKTSWESTSLPVRNPLQPRPFGQGIQARRAELPTTNVLQTRPFGTPKQASTPKQEMPELQAKLKQAESFGYNAANIPTVPSSNATPIQAKLTIGEPNDKYEQEADQVASQVVNQINSPQSQQSVQGKTVQRQEMPEEEEELQAKPLAESIQRQEMPEEEEELQAKPLAESIQRQEMPEEEEELQMKPLLQRQSSGGGMAATPELEESIQRAKGSGQPLSENIRQPMEQAFGADFSGVKVHTDTQSDQLNQSIQAKAFTTGENIFFKQGEYNPGSKGGQELLAHELTHVVQQTGRVQAKHTVDQLAQESGSNNPDSPLVQRDGGVTAGVGLALSAAGFATSTRSAGNDAFGNTNVQFRYSREENGPDEPIEETHTIVEVDSIKGTGSSFAFLELVLKHDGHNIITAYTQQSKVRGYDGGMFGSEAAVNFTAVECSQPTDPVTKAYILFQGFNNPSGPGFQRFRGRILVTGDGQVECQECELTEGSGYARTSPWCEVGWD